MQKDIGDAEKRIAQLEELLEKAGQDKLLFASIKKAA
jgi:hypothetical protein